MARNKPSSVAEAQLKKLLNNKQKMGSSNLDKEIKMEELRGLAQKVAVENAHLNKKIDLLLEMLVSAAEDMKKEDTGKRINAILEAQMVMTNKVELADQKIEEVRERGGRETRDKLDTLSKQTDALSEQLIAASKQFTGQLGDLNLYLTTEGAPKNVADTIIREMNRKFGELVVLKTGLDELSHKADALDAKTVELGTSLTTLGTQTSGLTITELREIEKEMIDMKDRLLNLNLAVKDMLPHAMKSTEIKEGIEGLDAKLKKINSRIEGIETDDMAKIDKELQSLGKHLDEIDENVSVLTKKDLVGDVSAIKYKLNSVNTRLGKVFDKTLSSAETTNAFKDDLGKLTYKVDTIKHEIEILEKKMGSRVVRLEKQNEAKVRKHLEVVRTEVSKMPASGSMASDALDDLDIEVSDLEERVRASEKGAEAFPKLENELKVLELDLIALSEKTKSKTIKSGEGKKVLEKAKSRLKSITEKIEKTRAKEVEAHAAAVKETAKKAEKIKVISKPKAKAVERRAEVLEIQLAASPVKEIPGDDLDIIEKASIEAVQVEPVSPADAKRAEEMKSRFDSIVSKVKNVQETQAPVAAKVDVMTAKVAEIKRVSKEPGVKKSAGEVADLLKNMPLPNASKEIKAAEKAVAKVGLPSDLEKLEAIELPATPEKVAASVSHFVNESTGTEFNLKQLATELKVPYELALDALDLIETQVYGNVKIENAGLSARLLKKDVVIKKVGAMV
ncbi:MAG: hypothetical protein GOV15_02055 [Candidatus Diapherotrites archaeon]|nr:hypothetical protein [Candidatus Diapherotrites archaeon]